MLNEKKFQDSVNRRLSGLSACEQRRMRIRAVIQAERQEVSPVKRKMSAALVFALILVLLMASLAIADSMNLFGFFGQRDERYAKVAEDATLTAASPAEVNDAHLGQVKATMDSAYFDGLALSLAFRITGGTGCEMYIPAEEELSSMEKISAPIHDMLDGQPDEDVVVAFNQAVESGTPYGYRHYSVYPSDHTVTDDGVDIPPYASSSTYDEDGSYCELREFELPLPEELRSRDSLTLTIDLYQSEALYYFDGKDCYYAVQRRDAGTFTAVVEKTEDQVRSYAGEGVINGVACRATAEVSRMAGVVSLACDAPLNAFLAAPEGTDPADSWVVLDVYDQAQQSLRATGGYMLDESTGTSAGLYGTGELPESLTLYVYPQWEGMDEPDLSALDAITLTLVP